MTTDHADDGQQAEPDMNAFLRGEVARLRDAAGPRMRDYLDARWDPGYRPPPGPYVHQPRPAPHGTLPVTWLFPHDPQPPAAA